MTPPLYVYALTSSPLETFRVGRSRIESFRFGGITVVAERAATPPKTSETALRHQHAVVEAIAARADAVLPARFGSLVDQEELSAILELRGDAVLQALDLVRGRVQMTVRFPAEANPPRPAAGAQARKPVSGAAYLRARRAAVTAPAPPALDALREAVAPLLAAERRDLSAGRAFATVYHLIPAGSAEDYRQRVEGASLPRAVRVTGPWPAFAFTPELLG